jgi:hypothetical protein
MEPHPSPSIESLRNRSEQSRAQLKETISQFSQTLSDTTDELKTNLSPHHLKEEVRAYANEKKANAVQALRDNVANHPLEVLAIGAVLTYPLLGIFRKVPVPLALIGAGLLLSRNRDRSTVEKPAESKGLENGGETTNGEGLGGRLRTGLDEGQASVVSAGTKTAEAVADMATSAISGVQSTTEDIAARAAKVGKDSKDALAGMVHSNPLLLGGVAIAIGGFIAASIPAFRIEERVLGKGGEALKDTVRKAADGAIAGAKAEATKVADNISAAARETGLTPEALDETVDTVADKIASVVDRGVNAAIGANPKRQTEDTRDGDEMSQSAGDQAPSLGQEVKAAASEAGEKVTDTVREQAAKVGDRARSVAADTGKKIENALNEQRASGADYLQNVAGLVHQAADIFDTQVPQASRYIHQAAQQIDTVAEAVRTKNVQDAVHDVQDFARRQPAIFFGGALLLGFAAVRLLKTSTTDANQNGGYAG